MANEQPKKFSLSFGVKKLAPPKSVNGKRRRALQDTEHDYEEAPFAQEVSGFDQSTGGAISTTMPSGNGTPLVIPVGPNRYKQTSRGPPQKSKEDQPLERNDDKKPEEEMVYGLNVRKREQTTGLAQDNEVIAESATQPPEKQKTDDEVALEALLGSKQTSATPVIPAVSEDEAFHKDYDDAPDVPTLDDYAAIPVEQFGAALLRGMGWKDGEAIGKNRSQAAAKTKKVERRPALLGVGAAPAASLGIEIGTWGKNERGQKKEYNPVVLKNKVTGEVITEEELKAKLAEQRNSEMEIERGVPDTSLAGSRRREDRKDDRIRATRDRYHDPNDNRDRYRKDERGQRDSRHERARDRDDKPRGSDRDRSASYDDQRNDRHRISNGHGVYKSRTSDGKDRTRHRSRDHNDSRGDYSKSRRERSRQERSSSPDSRRRDRRREDDRYESSRKYRDDRERDYKYSRSRSERY